MKIVDKDSPNRCQATDLRGQCPYEATYDHLCGKHTDGQKEKKHVRNYQLTKWQAELERHSSSSGIKSLRDEVGIARMTLEILLNKCESTTQLLAFSNQIGDLVMKINTLVTSCHRLEGSMGELLDKQTILHFASRLLDVINDEIPEKKKEAIANKVMQLVKEIDNEASNNNS